MILFKWHSLTSGETYHHYSKIQILTAPNVTEGWTSLLPHFPYCTYLEGEAFSFSSFFVPTGTFKMLDKCYTTEPYP